tara:strand:- start:952 stop:1200 length:249 start_codon:yes stop_codon:yes gene_type:complete
MSVAEAVYVETCRICETVSKWFQKVLIEMQRGKQLHANKQIMSHLPAIRSVSDVKEMSFNLDKMNDLTNEMYDKMLVELENK